MQCAMKETELHHVNVFQSILVIHMLLADQNALSTLTAPQVKHVSNFTALILAQELVGLMQIAGFKIIFQHAHVLRVTLETLSQHVD